ncbi:hypothetical protein KL86PLE_110045 [uncultured Pleomorphomonas sp.]|uniref:Uncharacterized protein n=1 Tax=uncultured Pleomorphomonas sp. TaxID=442121 RepID=A0A212L735_9HYPH|nr:hypothetical protein [uncultured Pleomorphomonas sp.]SCM73383.1 hypothetical protein KL86PLE_110045 [uncultured Pleomorphomonas sp.]
MDIAAATTRMDAAVAATYDAATLVFQPRRAGTVPGSTGAVRDVNRPAEDDPARPVQTVKGSFWLRPDPSRMPRSLSPDPGVQSGAATVSYDAMAAVFAAAFAVPPQKGDHVTAGADLYRVEAMGSHGLGRVAYYLNRVK